MYSQTATVDRRLTVATLIVNGFVLWPTALAVSSHGSDAGEVFRTTFGGLTAALRSERGSVVHVR